MEEADWLADDIVVMAAGRVAAQGSALDLKSRYGAGYSLTLVLQPSAAAEIARQSNRDEATAAAAALGPAPPLPPPTTAQTPLAPGAQQSASSSSTAEAAAAAVDATQAPPLPSQDPSSPTHTTSPSFSAHPSSSGGLLEQLRQAVRHHVPAAHLLGAAGAEVSFALPKEACRQFPALLRHLDASKQQLRIQTYGLSVTTLEECFLRITEAAGGAANGGRPQGGGPLPAGPGAADQSAEPVAAAALQSLPPPPPGGKRRSPFAPLQSGSTTSAAAAAATEEANETASSAAGGSGSSAAAVSSGLCAGVPPYRELTGAALWGQQFRALVTKRALSARRDRLAVLTQLLVPLALVFISLWLSQLSISMTSEPPLPLSRSDCLFDGILGLSAAPELRNGGNSRRGDGRGGDGGGLGQLLARFVQLHPANRVVDTGATGLWAGAGSELAGTLDGYLLDSWYTSAEMNDALHVAALPPPADVAAGRPVVFEFTLMHNQSAVSGLPAALSSVHSAVLRYVLASLEAPPSPPPLPPVQPPPGAPSRAAPPPPDQPTAPGPPPGRLMLTDVNLTSAPAAAATAAAQADSLLAAAGSGGRGGAGGALPAFATTNHPLPTLPFEPQSRVRQDAASLMMVLCLTLATSVLSASFVVALVREAASGSKHVQLVSGAPISAFWASNYAWDLANFALPAAAIVALIAGYQLPSLSGARLGAVAALLAAFGASSLPLTYLTHFAFSDEMQALQKLNTAYFLV